MHLLELCGDDRFSVSQAILERPQGDVAHCRQTFRCQEAPHSCRARLGADICNQGGAPRDVYAMHVLSMMCFLVNGARAELFPSSESPFFHLFFNINYSQTRKSSITANGDAFGDQLDKRASKTIKERFEHLANSGDDPSGTQSQASPNVMSAVIHSATPAEFFHRCAGDFDQVKNVDELGHDKLRGRHNFGVLVNLDEAYDFLQCEGRTWRSQSQSISAQQIDTVRPGKSAKKSCGSFGAAGSPTVSC